jgi:hypothetical protein
MRSSSGISIEVVSRFAKGFLPPLEVLRLRFLLAFDTFDAFLLGMIEELL